MSNSTFHFFPENRTAALALCQRLNIPAYPIEVHKFPDGESRIQIHPTKGTAIVYMSLDNPNEKLVHLAFAANALRESGVQRIILVSPYLCYMRQDRAFHPGEAISQQVIGSFLSTYFDRFITVDPHLHRISVLQSVFPECLAESLSAAQPISDALSYLSEDKNIVFVGPDEESAQWVGAIANSLAKPFIVAKKQRRGDRNISVALPEHVDFRNVHAIIIDDVISSGATICRCAEMLLLAGAKTVEAVAVHILCKNEDLIAMKNSGVSRILSTDSIGHETNCIPLASLLAAALKEEV
ncbi:MAG: ribose-phosphate diphosphokinase [Sneathiella sp.]